MPPLSQTRAYVALFLVAALWGTFPATAKLAFRDFPPVFLTLVRCLLASAFLVALLLRSGAGTVREVTADSVRAFLVLGVTGIVLSMQVTYVALYHTTAANGAILQAAAPVMVVLGARLYLGERLQRVQRVGVAVSALGVLLVVTDGGLAAIRPQNLRIGDFLILFALVGWTLYTLYAKRLLASYSPALLTTGGYVGGTLLLVPIALATAPLFPRPALASPLAWAIVIAHALLGALAHVWWNRAVQRVGASRSIIFMNLTPVMGIGLAALLLGEPIGLWQVAGAGCVLAGVGFTTRTGATGPGRQA